MTASDCFRIINKNKSLNNDYIYYYLKLIQDDIYKLQSGVGQPHIYSKDLLNLKIGIPSIEKQKEIIDYIDNNNDLINNLEKEIEKNNEISREILNDFLK